MADACIPTAPVKTPMRSDVQDLFNKMGAKLGWFEYKDLETAYKELSKSSKKKNAKKNKAVQEFEHEINSESITKSKDTNITTISKELKTTKGISCKEKSNVKPKTVTSMKDPLCKITREGLPVDNGPNKVSNNYLTSTITVTSSSNEEQRVCSKGKGDDFTQRVEQLKKNLSPESIEKDIDNCSAVLNLLCAVKDEKKMAVSEMLSCEASLNGSNGGVCLVDEERQHEGVFKACAQYSSDDDNDDAALELFLEKMRKPTKELVLSVSSLAMPRPSLFKLHSHLARVGINRSLNILTINFQKLYSSGSSLKDFIVDDGDVTSGSDDEGEGFYVKETRRLDSERSQSVSSWRSPVVIADSDSDDDDFKVPTSIQRTRSQADNRTLYLSLDGSSSSLNESSPEFEDVKSCLFSASSDTSSSSHKGTFMSDSDSKENISPSEVYKTPSSTNSTAKPRLKHIPIKMDSSSSLEDVYQTPLSVMGPKQKTPNDNVFQTPATTIRKKTSSAAPKSHSIHPKPTISSSSSDVFYTPKGNISSNRTDTVSNDSQLWKTPLSVRNTGSVMKSATRKTPLQAVGQTCSVDLSNAQEINLFLKSFSPGMEVYRKPEAERYVKHFKKLREDLTNRLFIIYNTIVFENQLPSGLVVMWNNRLLKTAGQCNYRHTSTGKACEIQLSTKVCDSAERVRDTLIHELCHAATWVINGCTDGHGPYWKYWAKKSNIRLPDLPIISRCHSYSINTKYIYKCVQCGYQVGRHSKSLDTDKKVCGHCHGRFELLVCGSDGNPKPAYNGRNTGSSSQSATPRTPNKFALFVKDNYKCTKEQNRDLPHKDIMNLLSKDFASKNKIN